MKIDENDVVRRARLDKAGKGAKTGGLIGLAVGAGLLALTAMITIPLVSTWVGAVFAGGAVFANGFGATAMTGLIGAGAVVAATSVGGALIGGMIGAVNADTERAVDEAYAKAERMEERNMARGARQRRTQLAMEKQELENERQATMLGLRPSFGGFEPPAQGGQRGV